MTDGEQWRAAVERSLAGAPFESLVTATLEGIPIAPLYTERHLPNAQGIPWAPRPERGLGRFHEGPGLPDLAAERAAGASFVWSRAELPTDLSVPTGIELLVQPEAPVASVSRAGPGSRVLADPFSAPVARAQPIEDPLLDALATAIPRGAAVLGADALAWDELGVSAVDEIAFAVASLVLAVRELEARGVAPGAALASATVAVGLGTDFFVEIAKLRALRRLLARVLAIAGAPGVRPLIAARARPRMLSYLDPPTNLLRITLAVAAGLIGGADLVAAPSYRLDAPDTVERQARNVALVLALESHLAADADPARGSYYLEALTSELAQRAWDLLREIERRGGFCAAQRFVRERAEASAAARRRAIATRARPLVGVSKFPVDGELPPASSAWSDAGPYERLRRRGADRTATLVVLPGCPQARIDFAREVAALAFAKVEIVDGIEAAAGGSGVAFLCAADGDLAGAAVEAARALRAAGVRAIALAAQPGPQVEALRAAGVDALVYLGCDLVEALEALLARAEVPA